MICLTREVLEKLRGAPVRLVEAANRRSPVDNIVEDWPGCSRVEGPVQVEEWRGWWTCNGESRGTKSKSMSMMAVVELEHACRFSQ